MLIQEKQKIIKRQVTGRCRWSGNYLNCSMLLSITQVMALFLTGPAAVWWALKCREISPCAFEGFSGIYFVCRLFSPLRCASFFLCSVASGNFSWWRGAYLFTLDYPHILISPGIAQAFTHKDRLRRGAAALAALGQSSKNVNDYLFDEMRSCLVSALIILNILGLIKVIYRRTVCAVYVVIA